MPTLRGGSLDPGTPFSQRAPPLSIQGGIRADLPQSWHLTFPAPSPRSSFQAEWHSCLPVGILAPHFPRGHPVLFPCKVASVPTNLDPGPPFSRRAPHSLSLQPTRIRQALGCQVGTQKKFEKNRVSHHSPLGSRVSNKPPSPNPVNQRGMELPWWGGSSVAQGPLPAGPLPGTGSLLLLFGPDVLSELLPLPAWHLFRAPPHPSQSGTSRVGLSSSPSPCKNTQSGKSYLAGHGKRNK